MPSRPNHPPSLKYRPTKPNSPHSSSSFPSSAFMAPASLRRSSAPVCVMDASGAVGAALVHRLLRRGYTVHAALQPQRDLDGFSDGDDERRHKNLKIFRSDPFDFQSIVEAITGCSGLFYAFEPPHDCPTYDESMAEVEARAAHNVVQACAQSQSIHKLVFTSSATAVAWSHHRHSGSAHVGETHWTDTGVCRKYKLWHALSKAMAEKAAWGLAMDRGVNMVCLNPGLILAPHRPLPIAAQPYLKGAAEMYEDGVLVAVDLDYLVRAHICVYEDASAYGRYLCFNHTITRHRDAVELAQLLAAPAAPPPPSCGNDGGMIQQKISNTKLNKLMEDFELQVD